MSITFPYISALTYADAFLQPFVFVNEYASFTTLNQLLSFDSCFQALLVIVAGTCLHRRTLCNCKVRSVNVVL